MNDNLSTQYINFIQPLFRDVSNPLVLTNAYERDWLSDCIYRIDDDNNQVCWQPIKRDVVGDFSGIEKALQLTIHSDIKYLFGAWWSGHIEAQTERGPYNILHAWNEQDFDGLLQNIVGHLLMKQQLKQQPTVFFATTDEDDYILSVLNTTGEVALERVGLEPQEIIADSLSTFFANSTFRSTMLSVP